MAEYERVCQREKELVAKMNRGNSSHSLKSVSSWTQLPSVRSIFSPLESSSSSQAKEAPNITTGDSFKSTQSAVSVESKISADSGFASTSSSSQSTLTNLESNHLATGQRLFQKRIPSSKSCYAMNPISSSSVSEAVEGQESSVSHDKLFITRL